MQPRLEGLLEAPVGRSSVVGFNNRSITESGAEGESLSGEVTVTSELPHLSPVTLHGVPSSLGALDLQLLHVTGAADVRDEHEKEPRVSVDLEPNAALLRAGDAPVVHWDHTSSLLSKLHEHRHRQVEVLPGDIAPPSLTSLWAEIRRCDHD